MANTLKHLSSILTFAYLIANCVVPASAEDDILDFLPAIIAATVERKPPPPPPPAEWRVTNLVYCPSFKSLWTVNDGENSRSSLVRSSIIFSSNTSPIAEVEPGKRTFTWRLDTTSFNVTCGVFSNRFTRTLKSGFRYEFTLEPNSSGGLDIETERTRIIR